jgi:DNA (cytosine-5)-methyltransferase 1
MTNGTKSKLAAASVDRREAIRISQAAHRKRLAVKTKSVEVKRGTHKRIKKLADNKQTTLQDLLSGTPHSRTQPSAHDRPWSIFGKGPRAEEDCEFTHVSLFSGCGGFDLGFRQAGFKSVFANDIDADACQSYRRNLGEIVEGDVRTVEFPRLKRRLDVLTAGFPCQPFSNAGSRKGIQDDRGTLFQTAIDSVAKLRPRVVVFENVRGILSFRNGQRLLMEEICSQLDKLGYDVTFSLVDASRHQVAQRRLRVLIVGVERNAKHGVFSFPQPVNRSDLTLEDTILDLTVDIPNQSELMQLNPQAIHLGSMVPEGGSWKDIPYKKLPPRLQRIWDNIERYRWPNFYRRFHRNEVAGTITAAFKPENAGVWHPTEKRIFSVREIGRIQSFPDWFIFDGRTVKSKYQQIGNAVPPRLAYELATQIVKVLRGEDLRKSEEYFTFEQFIATGKPLRACDRDVVFSPRKSALGNKS